MIVLGITGAIASGKTTVAGMFAEAGYPVLNADAVVHAIYRDPPPSIVGAFPGTITEGRVDRSKLAAMIADDPEAIVRLEAIVHPLVDQQINAFLIEQRARDVVLAVLEVPLLYETGTDRLCDKVLVTDAPPDIRAARVAERGGMTPELYQRLQERQLPADEKARRGDFVVDSSADLAAVRAAVRDIIAELTEGARRA